MQADDTPTPDSSLGSFDDPLNIAVIGATGGIGSALVREISKSAPDASVHALSRNREARDVQGTSVTAIELEN